MRHRATCSPGLAPSSLDLNAAIGLGPSREHTFTSFRIEIPVHYTKGHEQYTAEVSRNRATTGDEQLTAACNA